METLKILLCCGASMSSDFLASNARKAAKKKKPNVTIEVRNASKADELPPTIDIPLIDPRYAKGIDKLQELANLHGVAVALIPKGIYGSLDDERLITFAQTLRN